MVQDTIERQIEIDADAERVWKLIGEPGWWINDGEYRTHRIEPADGHDVVHDPEHGAFAIRTEQLDPPRYARFSWLAGEAGEGTTPGTTVEFFVDDREGGVVLRVVESGFRSLPGDEESRRRTWTENDEGWVKELAVAKTVAEDG